jgi:WD40 repeat protein
VGALEGHSDYVSSVVFSATGQLASASDDGTVKL